MPETNCPKSRLHNYELSKEDSKTLKETCTFCGHSVYWNKDKTGRLDNRRYARAHLRDFLQPHGRDHKLFLEVYGEPRHHAKATKPNWVQEGEEAKTMIQDLRKARQTL